MAGYFSGVPNFDYVDLNPDKNNISDYTTVKNLFKRGKIRDEIFGDTAFFDRYIIEGDERPDHIAYQVYDDETLDWVVLLSNNILNINTEWPLTQKGLNDYLLEKYKTYDTLYNGIKHYVTEEIKNSNGVTVLPSGITLPKNQWKTNGAWVESQNTKILEIYSGDGITTSNIVTVITYGSGITNLEEGSQVTISNVDQEIYNGQHIVKELINITDISPEDYEVNIFTYELPTAPEVARPTLSFVLNDQGIAVGSHLEEVRLTLSNTNLSGNAYYFEYYDNSTRSLMQVPANEFLRAVTNYEYEIELEEKKREIFILKREYVDVLFEDIQNYMPYKEGGEQYISPTLKRGDNIKLYQ